MPRRVAGTGVNGRSVSLIDLKNLRTNEAKLLKLHDMVESLTGVYTRVGKRLKVSRSYVSRVARGERRSDQIERALLLEFERLVNWQQKRR